MACLISKHTCLWCDGDVMVEELSKLHGHVGEALGRQDLRPGSSVVCLVRDLPRSVC